MGDSQSKPKKQQQQQKQQIQVQRQQSPKIKKLEKKVTKLTFDSCINISEMKQFLEKEDPIVQYLPQAKEQTESEQQQQLNVNDYIDFQLIPRYKNVKLSKNESTKLPVMISLEAKAPQQEQSNRPPIDLVCVIDDSGSMSGHKAQLVRKSLKYLLKLLNQNDRLCLISYDCHAKVLTPFLRNTDENKQQLKDAIKYINGKGSTNTTEGMEKGLWMIKNRKQKNPVSCMFLLSDGQDNYYSQINSRIQQLVSYYDIQEQYTINTYGYGLDHNPDVMLEIAKMKDGNFYFIENLKKVSDWFILSLSGLLTVLAEKVQIRLRKQKNYEISKYYGEDQVWDKDNIIHLPHLTQSCKKEYLVELSFPKQKELLKDEKKYANALQSIIMGTALEGQIKEINIETDLNIQFSNHDEPAPQNELVEKFEVAYIRAKGGEIIGEACEISKKGEYEKANKLLDDLLKEIDENPFKEHRGINFIRNDLLKSKDVCKPQVFEKQGKGFMYKKKKDHLQRQASLCSIQDWDQNQQDMFNNYENGDYNLSDDSCCSDMEDNNQQQYQQQNYSRGSIASYTSEDENDDNLSDIQQQQQIPQKKQKRKSSIKLPKRQYSAENLSDSGDSD